MTVYQMIVLRLLWPPKPVHVAETVVPHVGAECDHVQKPTADHVGMAQLRVLHAFVRFKSGQQHIVLLSNTWAPESPQIMALMYAGVAAEA